MPKLLIQLSNNHFFSLFFIASLASALFYTGNNTWLFTASYIFIVFNIYIVIKQRFYNSIAIPLNGILASSLLLLIWFAITIFTSQIKYLSLYNFFWVGSLIIAFVLFTINENKEQIWNSIWPAILMLVSIWAVYGLVQHYYLHVSANASFLNRNSLAALINLAIIPASGYFLLNEKDRPWSFLNNKILSLTLVLLFLTLFIITSRGASLSLMLGFTILLSLLYKHVNKSQIITLVIIILISFFLVNISQFFTFAPPESFADRMITLQDSTKAGNTRFVIWESLLPLFNEMPWYGLGLGSLWVFWPPYRADSDRSAGYFAHNDYMQITLEAGYPGIILLVALFIFILITFIRTIKNNKLTLIQRVEITAIFAALTSFAAHSIFTYNFYILPLLIIAGIYLGRFNQLATLNSKSVKTLSALKKHFHPITFLISLLGIIVILCSYFLTLSLSSYYNKEAKKLMLNHQYQESSALFLKAQSLAPLMDNPYFSHADLLRRGANKLLSLNQAHKANSLLKLAHRDLDTAEKRHPFRPQTFHIRGLIYERSQPKKAMLQYEKALKLDPRFLFARIRLAKLLYKQKKLKPAMEVLYEGVNYNYPVNKVMLEYMTFFAKLSREAGVENFALHLEANIKKFTRKNYKK